MVTRFVACIMFVAAGLIVGCSQNNQADTKAANVGEPEKKVANQPEQKITPLSDAQPEKKVANQPEQKITPISGSQTEKKVANQPEQKKKPLSGGQPEKKVANQPEQKITPLNGTDQKRLRDQRAVVERYLRDEDSKKKYKTAQGKLGTIRTILDGKVFKADQTHELQCLGIVLGDVFVQDLGMEWIMVEDEYGRDPAVRLPNTTIILFPMTMIAKRIDRGEKVDVFELYNAIAAQVKVLKAKMK